MNPNYKAMTKLSMELKVIPRSYRGYKYILVVNDEVTDFMVNIPVHQSRSEEIGDALIQYMISK